MNLTYKVSDKPKFGQLLIFAFQQLLAILAATIAVPAIVGNGMSPTAALFGAGVGTLVYLLFTKFKSPVFLGSSFAFLPSMFAAFAGAVSVQAGYAGMVIGALFAALVYVVLSILVKAFGTGWIDKIMPAVVIGPTVAIIGLSLAGNAVGDLFKGNVTHMVEDVAVQNASVYVCVLCGLITLIVTMLCSVYGKKMMKLIPFIIGIVAGYIVAAVFTAIGAKTGNQSLMLIDFSAFKDMQIFAVPDFTFLTAAKGLKEISASYIATVAVAYIPVAFVVFAEHIADHKNLSTIINRDLITDPGLDRTLIGDGVGSIIGSFFGGCPNTTYGESVGCVAITGNASISTIAIAAVYCIILSFFDPFVCFVNSIPSCIVGGVCIALYGFIAVSGLKMLQPVDLNDNRNLFVVAAILVPGIGGLTLNFTHITVSSIAVGLILGIIVNVVFNKRDKAGN